MRKCSREATKLDSGRRVLRLGLRLGLGFGWEGRMEKRKRRRERERREKVRRRIGDLVLPPLGFGRDDDATYFPAIFLSMRVSSFLSRIPQRSHCRVETGQ